MSTTSQMDSLQSQVHNASADVIPWVVWLARFGYAAKGLVYITIGALAVQVAIGSGGRTTGPAGALASLSHQPFGQILLILVAVGLFGYALWRFVQSWVDPEHEGSNAKGIVKRIGYAVSGIIYAAFGIEAVRLVLGSGGGSNESQQASDWTARLMSQPFGIWLVGIVGAIVIGTGLYQFYRAYSAKFREVLKLHEMNANEERWATRAGRLGFAARGVVYSIIGIFLVIAAMHANPDEAVGIGEALQKLAQQPYGPWLLGLVAIGLVAYGFFAIVLARYRRIFIPAS
ncbi:MAG TPA: DUF1206 domain-containing protein [Caldilineaceae bacterium]|nr:DUF1206 domain-containing protein [Caldilineaceae bacterium]